MRPSDHPHDPSVSSARAAGPYPGQGGLPAVPAPLPDGASGPFSGGHRPDPRSRALLVTGALTLVLGAVALFLPAPYVVESPGPTFNTVGTVETAEGEEAPLIEIEGAPTYPTNGELDLTTVYVAGGPGTAMSFLEAVGAWLNPEDAVVPQEFVYPRGTTGEDIDQQNAAAMTSSQEASVAAALRELDVAFSEDLSVAELVDGSPAAGVLEAGDTLLSVGGTDIDGIDTLREELQASGGAPVEITFRRDGREQTGTVTPVLGDTGSYQLGIFLATSFEFPFEVTIALNDVGGPSAGMMFALGIIDRLTPGELTGGKHFAGTGTIDSAGNVGAIGGIQQKMVGASDAGAEFFLAPADNCGEVVGHIPEGLDVVRVATLDEARTAVEALAGGTSPAELAQCTADQEP
ncbi:PDZ domain-containing protein [Arthrobacter sp. zg-Y820]|uniref:YlbL family protein n=1 Tax=unclassified Arthrobacter TaxID=235627 RepID=UPI001E4A862E|nr:MULTISPECIES: PDZ domain-containing protein [unclassified Arthrobacter]MCC9195954.1 PDZ domain-containing protein [Arthrobacter sp. zg-Y820]MDK1278813.1 PDZ domain-containing protein [Arthrobacter sp. zg.Y820]WIB08769.1 PDZ domain-containing protein [Arthrobacter sp. zg-Y820]